MCNKEQPYALIDAEAGILIYSFFLKKTMHLNAGSTIKESQPDIPSSSGSKLTYATHAASSCIMQVSLARAWDACIMHVWTYEISARQPSSP
jgi:hypothetical protein